MNLNTPHLVKSNEDIYVHDKEHLVGPDMLYKRSLDSAVSSLLALISREYVTVCPAHQQFIYTRHTRTIVVQWFQN